MCSLTFEGSTVCSSCSSCSPVMTTFGGRPESRGILMTFKDVGMEADYKAYRDELVSHRLLSALVCFGAISMFAGAINETFPRIPEGQCNLTSTDGTPVSRCAYTQLTECDCINATTLASM